MRLCLSASTINPSKTARRFHHFLPAHDASGYPPACMRKNISSIIPRSARRYPTFTASSAVAGVASGLRILRGLGCAADSGRRYSGSPPSARGRTHAVAGHVAGRGRRWKLSCATHGQRAARRFNIRGSRIAFRMRPISLLTRLSAAANTCLRCKGCSAVPGSFRLSALLSRARPGGSRAPACVPYRAYRADAGATPQGHQARHRRFRDGDCAE